MGYAALLYDRLTIDEAELLLTADRRGLTLKKVFTKDPSMLSETDLINVHVVVNRCESKNRALEAARRVTKLNRIVINSYRVEELCSNKIKTIEVLDKCGIKVPKGLFKQFPRDLHDSGNWIDKVIEEAEAKLEYPIVFKPTHGSWGKGIIKIDCREHLMEALRENAKPSEINPEGIFLQEYIEKPGFDLRIIAYKERRGIDILCCIARVSRRPEEFRTNTHLGGLPVGVELESYPNHVNEVLKAAKTIMQEEEYSIIALDAMPQIENTDYSIVYKLTSECVKIYDKIRKFVDENKFKRYSEWKNEMELMFQKLKMDDSYIKLRNVISRLLESSSLKIHEANSRFDYAMNTRNATGVNPAEKYVDLCLEVLRSL
ncbi:MAG: sugar-transfer associated ATP-grasp domain-containing protein [Candidatus Bathyarchaeia archaeon]